MKVVFLEDVPNIAEVGQIKDVSDGYARHYLIPKKLAVLANSAASNILEAQLKKKAKQLAQTEAEMTKVAQQLKGKELVLKAKVGAKERLYGSITSTDIADGIRDQLGLDIDKRKIELAEPIRELGSYDVSIKLFKDISPQIKVTVAAEEIVTEEKKEIAEKKPGKAEKKTGVKEEAEEKTETAEAEESDQVV